MLDKFKSVRLHLFILIFILGLLPAFCIKEIMLASYEGKMVEQRNIELRYAAGILAKRIGNVQYLSEALDDKMLGEINQLAEIYNGRILLIDDSFKIVADTYSIDLNKTCISEEVFQGFRGDTSYYNYNKEKMFVEMILPVTYTSGKETKTTGIMFVSASTSSIRELVKDMNSKADILEVFLSVIMLVVAYMLSNYYTKPLKKVSSNINNVKEGNLDVEIEETGFSEVRAIVESFNAVLHRLKAIDQSRQEFVSNVSHELKTPITSIRVLADSLMLQDDVPVELYREFLGDISDEIDRETKIINDLLALVKLDKTATEMTVEQVNINELLEIILKRVRPIAKKRNIELVFESFRPVIAEVDETKFSLALTNLIENAVKYNKDEGWVKVSLNADHKYFYVTVTDSGVGIPEDARDHIFERFYRVDKARSRETGGTGLGLAITRSVILLHHGAIRLESKVGEGSTFIVRIPLTYLA
ncbi:MAG: sensor histidine kinase [Lachnospiraceae bacterium]